MRTLLPLLMLLLAACGPSGPVHPAPPPDAGEPRPDAGPRDAGQPDAGEPDAGEPDAGRPVTTRLDWRTVRGAPLQPTVVAEVTGQPFALGDTTFAVWSHCDAGVCAATWYDDGGKVVHRYPALAPAATGWFSPSGRQFAAIEVERTQRCEAGGYTSTLHVGRWTLFDAHSGERLFSTPHVGEDGTLRSTFSTYGGLAWRDPVDPQTCEFVSTEVVLTQPPYEHPRGLDGLTSDVAPYAEDDFRDGQVLASTRRGLTEQTWLVHARDAGSEFLHDGDMRTTWASGDWLHSANGYPYTRLFQTHVPTRTRREVPLPFLDDDFVRLDVSGPWAMACAFNLGIRCQLVDARGRFPTRTVAGGRLPLMVGDDDFLLLRRPDAGVERFDLQTGAQAHVLDATGVVPVGRRRAAVAWSPTQAVGVTRTETIPFGHDWTRAVLPSRAVDQPQSDVVFVVSGNFTGHTTRLEAWNVATGKVALLTESLLFNPPSSEAFTADELCAAPGFVRTAGLPSASATQPGQLLHFTEFVPAAQPKLRVFVLPADLSSPPRLVAELDPDTCAPPLVSPSGGRLWLPVRMGGDRVRVVLTDL